MCCCCMVVSFAYTSVCLFLSDFLAHSTLFISSRISQWIDFNFHHCKKAFGTKGTTLRDIPFSINNACTNCPKTESAVMTDW